MIEKHPFQNYKLEDEREKGDIVKCRLNFVERQYLEALKLYHKTTKDSTALKNEAFRVYKQTALLHKKKK